MRETDNTITLAAGGAILIMMAMTMCGDESKPREPPGRSSAMSPASCEESGGCSIVCVPTDDGSFNDGTFPSDYSDHTYIGPRERAPECCATDKCPCKVPEE